MLRRILLAIALLLTVAPAAFAAGQWTTYLRLATANDLFASNDSVWIASNEAGVGIYDRTTDSWSSYTREPGGLAGNTVTRVAFDRSGFLWASVPGKGVSRLSPSGRWSLINAFDGLPSDSATVLTAQGDTMWIGTTNGIALWNGREIAGSIPDIGTPSPFADNTITGIVVYGDTLFVSTPVGVYLSRISQQLATWTLVNTGLIGPKVDGLAFDGTTVMALSTSGPVRSTVRWDNVNKRWLFDPPCQTCGVDKLRDDHRTIVAVTTQGTSTYGAGGWSQVPFAPTNAGATEAGVDPTDKLFAFSSGALREQAVPSFIVRVPPGPPGNNVQNVGAANGSVYELTFDEGIGRLRGGQWKNWAPGPVCKLPACDPDTTFYSSSFAFPILLDPLGPVWIGTWDGALTRFDDPLAPTIFQNIFVDDSTFAPSRHTYTWASAADSNQGATAGRWFGMDTNSRGDPGKTPIGIDHFDKDGNFIRNYAPGYPGLDDGQIRALAVDKANLMWIGYAGHGIDVAPIPASLDSLLSLTDLPFTKTYDIFGIVPYGDTIWVMATNGLHRFNRSSRQEVTLSQLAGPPAPRGAVHPLAVGPDGTVYVGTTGGVRVHRRGQFPTDFTEENSPLANNEVRSVFVEPTGVVWIATAAGLNRYDPFYVAPPPPQLSALRLRVWPNPLQRTGIGFQMKLAGAATQYSGEIYDIRGRVVHRFRVNANANIVWDGRGPNGLWVDPGIYFLRARGDGAEGTTRIVVL